MVSLSKHQETVCFEDCNAPSVFHEDAGIPSIGWWTRSSEAALSPHQGFSSIAERFREITYILRSPGDGSFAVGFGGKISPDPKPDAYLCIGALPAFYPEWLGDRKFCEVHGLRFPYVSGAMAGGIASVAVVTAMARSGMMGFFGSAGLGLERTERAIVEIQAQLDSSGLPYGINLIHSPNEPGLEHALVEMFLKRGVRKVEASAFMKVTPAIVLYSAKGLKSSPDGSVLRDNFVFAKVSRPELAEQFLSPAPAAILESLVAQGKLSADEAALASRIPIAEDITVEADSGGHTDNRPLVAMFTAIASRRDRLFKKFGYVVRPRIGAAGGLGTPESVAAAFALGADYVLTGSVNQSCVESGTSAVAKKKLAEMEIADVAMAPAADMFEIGAKVQVLKKGTMWPVRGQKLHEYYRNHKSFDEIPAAEREKIEKEILRDSFVNVWGGTREFFLKRDPSQVERAEQDPKHKMALVFRWYLGMGSRWAQQGEESRGMDYQIWCGPAQGAFNDWVRGSFLESPENREVSQIALNLLEGASAILRTRQFRMFGVESVEGDYRFAPRRLG